ncbi:rhodanese-like domain-containing protein [Campylobacter gastrosuis]|uniref:Rhodanese-like domain-containing protein n=1 Tax=Campylobacter gastrosuis TaxID=2974576 RepID=A0ABT7HR01_9BACT|nr:rhodanese-like domain-containing protein [Campylobacter gastrosuis]MDL0088819.1 rhodanese-like domain-containing protein [Campylobacter gastrosuis]
MKRFLLPFACFSSIFAQINVLEATPENVAKFEQIIDVRTPEEWRETGIIKGAKTISLTQDKERFLNEIKANVDLKKPIAIICRSGRRSDFAARMIDGDGLDITNLDGGMSHLINLGYETTPYKD